MCTFKCVNVLLVPVLYLCAYVYLTPLVSIQLPEINPQTGSCQTPSLSQPHPHTQAGWAEPRKDKLVILSCPLVACHLSFF